MQTTNLYLTSTHKDMIVPIRRGLYKTSQAGPLAGSPSSAQSSHTSRYRECRVHPNVQRQPRRRRQFPTRAVPVRMAPQLAPPSISSHSKPDPAWNAFQTISCTKSYPTCPLSRIVMQSWCWSVRPSSACCHGHPHSCARAVLRWHGRTLHSVVPKYQRATSCSSRR